jgi:integrase/recombinase XerC
VSALAILDRYSSDDTTEETADVNIGDLAQRYISERVRRGTLRPGSIPSARYTLGTLVDAVGWDLSPNRLTLGHIERWMERKFKGKPLSDSTKRTQLSTVRTFCRWMVRNGYARNDVTLGVDCPKQPRSVPRGVRNQAVGATHAACPDARADLIVTLEVQQTLRACEVCGLQLGDIDPDARLMLIRGKGGHERVLPITDDTWAAMTRYLAEHPANAGPLIRSYNHPNRGISARYVSRLVSEWMHAAGVNETGHALRHTAATDMLRKGGARA